MLAKKGASLKMATMSYDHYNYKKFAKTVYYAGKKGVRVERIC